MKVLVAIRWLRSHPPSPKAWLTLALMVVIIAAHFAGMTTQEVLDLLDRLEPYATIINSLAGASQ